VILIAAATVLLAAPATMTALIAAVVAWARGWPPARLGRSAVFCVPMVVAWLVALGVRRGGLSGVGSGPADAWQALWRARSAHSYVVAAIGVAPVAIPLGLVAGGLIWSVWRRSRSGQTGGASPGAALAFDERQWRRQVRTAQGRTAAPGSVPLVTVRGDVAVGAVIRSDGHSSDAMMRLPAARLSGHQIVLGGTGTGKTTLLLRLWAGFMATGLARHAAGRSGPPLLVVLDCKGGADARRIAERARRVLREAGARRVAIWPDEASLNLWNLQPRQLITTLVDLIEHGTGSAAYYSDVMEAVVALAVEAPGGPPGSTRDFLDRLDPGWLTLAYAAGGFDDELQMARAAAGQAGDIALRFRTLMRRLGGGLDGTGAFADADAWYCILEGTSDIAMAEAQARALVDMLAAHLAEVSSGSRTRPQMLLAVDEFSAVARRLPIWQLYERARSLGLAVQVSAQSWHGLAPTETERYRIASAAEGGIWLLRTAHPEPVTGLAGQRKAVAETRELLGFLRWGPKGSSRVQDAPVADPARIRALDTGQVAYIYRGGVTYVQIKRLVAGPAALSRGPVLAAAEPAVGRAAHADREPGAAKLPDITEFLDAAFGPPPPAAARRAP
jgi:hypothetical protein